jgi:D-alanine-D-alanine ligase
MANSEGWRFDQVVLVADMLGEEQSQLRDDTRTDLEKTGRDQLDAMRNAFQELGFPMVHYETPEALSRSAAKHSNDVVLSIFGGTSSRSRMALVPAICETHDLSYVGPDAYARIIAQDKVVSKRLAIDAGLKTPDWRLIRDQEDLASISGLSTGPLVVKPVLEGSSIGIGPNSLVSDVSRAVDQANTLLDHFGPPIMVEKFVAGAEVSYCRIEGATPYNYDGSSRGHWAVSEVVLDHDLTHFHSRLFDAQEKNHPSSGRTVRNVDGALSKDDREAIERLLRTVSPYGYTRVDGRLSSGVFVFLELTPDAWLAPTGQFAKAFTERGMPYEQVLKAILSTARRGRPYQ